MSRFFAWVLGFVVVVFLVLAGVYGYYSLRIGSYPKFQITSTITGVGVTLANEKSLDNYIKGWKTGYSFALANYPTDGNAKFQAVNTVKINFTADAQPYGQNVASLADNKTIISYNVALTGSGAVLNIFLDQTYWSSLGDSEASQKLSAFLMSYLYEDSHYPPKQTWKDLDNSRKIVFDGLNTALQDPILSVKFNP